MATNMRPCICFERVIPSQYSKIARQIARAENPANGSGFEAAALSSKLWRPGRTLHVAFLDGIPAVQTKVEYYAQQWSKYANITFTFGTDSNAEIRISFGDRGLYIDESSWSAIGTDALVEEYFPYDEPTMNYGWLAPNSSDADYSSVVLHEFGHALGMIHEHQSPASPIQWNEPIVIAAHAGKPNEWDEQTVRFNIFERYERSRTQFTRFDPHSIMLYSFPKEWTKNGLEFPVNYTLSQADKDFIKACYPR
jgi:Matrixin